MAARKGWLRPPALKRGDAVGVVAPAGPVEPGPLERGLRILRRMGLEPVEGRCLRQRTGFLAGSDSDRAEDLIRMFRDSRIRGILCARGGYGANRVLPYLKPALVRAHPKVVVGSSDITLLLGFLTQQCRLVCWHGPMVAASFGNRPMPRSQKQFARVLMGEEQGLHLRHARARVLRAGRARGRLAGGNLTLMTRSLGTPWELETRGALLLIEEVNEAPYRIDGMLWQLKQAGKFRGLKGVILGEMIGCRFPEGRRGTLDEVFLDHLGDLGVPILANCPIGHGPEIWTLPLGARAELDTGNRSLTVDPALVV